MTGDAPQVAGEAVGVADVADHPGLLEPVRHRLPTAVQTAELGAAVGQELEERGPQAVRHVVDGGPVDAS